MNKLNHLIIAIVLMATAPIAHSKTLLPEANQIQRVRIDFHTPLGYTRHLLLAFTPDNAATDGIDYGYDATNIYDYPDDMNWLIGGERYVIQGVGEFNVSKCYPLAIFLANSGTAGISLNSLENFETEINVYVYDALLGTFDSINSQSYSNTLADGNYLNRFYITFTDHIDQINIPDETLSLTENNFSTTSVKYLSKSKELLIDTKNGSIINELAVYNINAQELISLNINSDKIKIPLTYMVTDAAIIIKLKNKNGEQFYKKLVLY